MVGNRFLEGALSTTRRDFLASSLVAAAASILRPNFSLASLLQNPQPVFTPIRRNVGTFTMRGGTIGWLVNPDGVVVVDSQFPAEAKTLIDGLNTRSNNRPVDFLINTHHHRDHTDGNVSFRGVAKAIVAQENAAKLMHAPPGMEAPPDAEYPNVTFTEKWSADIGDEKVRAKYYGNAHTSGDIAVTFEHANVVHMGDLMFQQRHPIVDRAAGASIRSWIKILQRVPGEHSKDTIYIFGHANTGLPVTGDRADLARLHDYFAALLAFVQDQMKAGHSRAEVLAMRDPLKGFESFGRFGQPGARDALTCAYDEVAAG